MESFYMGHIGPSFLRDIHRDIHNTFTAENAESAEIFLSYIHNTFTAESAEGAEIFLSYINRDIHRRGRRVRRESF